MINKPIVFHNSRFTFLSEHTFKAEYSPAGKFIDKELFVTDINNVSRVKPLIKKTGDHILIKTKFLLIDYTASAENFSKTTLTVYFRKDSKGVSFSAPSSQRSALNCWHFGLRDTKNLGGSTLHLFKYPECVKPENVSEGALSRSGYFAYYDRTHTYWSANRRWATYEKPDGSHTVFFIGYGCDYPLALSEFSKIFGKAKLPPRYAFGFWYSRYFAYHQDEFVDLVKKYRGLGIPLDVMVIDTDWRKDVWKGYDWASPYFPDPDGFIKTMKELGVKLTLNDHPGYNSSEILPSIDSSFTVVEKFIGRKLGTEWRPDWGNRREVEAFCTFLLKPKIRQGIDFWWVDGWGADGLYRNPDYFKDHAGADPMGLGAEGYPSLNPQLWLNHFYYESTRQVTKKRPLILSRWGGFGSHRYPVWFSGDTYSTWETLAYQVQFTHTAGNALTNYWSHDLGGFLGREIAPDLFIRWIQFGAFSPIMRTHCDHGIREPWHFSPEILDSFRRYTRLRYRLIPYLYTYAHNAYATGMPMLRALYHNYPEDPRAYQYKHQYLLGDDILVAPVVAPQHGQPVVNQEIYFPAGTWLDLHRGDLIPGGTIRTLAVPLTEIPVFIRAGAVIPAAQDQQYLGEKKNDRLHFEIFGGVDRRFIYYEDDGMSTDYEQGKFITIPVSVKTHAGGTRITIGAMAGSYRGLIRKRKLTLVFHNRNFRSITAGQRNLEIKPAAGIFGELPAGCGSRQVELPYSGKSIALSCR